MKLQLSEIAVRCIIGDLPEERMREQDLWVDVELEIGETASMSDDLRDTVDYVELVKRIGSELKRAECRLIERAARVIAKTALEFSAVDGVVVRVTKRTVIPGLGAATAVYSLVREDLP